jgi:hypothetical protein
MATILTAGDLAIVQYNSSTTDSFTFVFARDIGLPRSSGPVGMLV